jgi:soluble lytic murein transglycosylase-like protein
MKKTTFFLSVFFCFSVQGNDFDYPWTERHSVLTAYAEKNKEHIIRFAPIKLERSLEYLDFIKRELRKENMPKELIILAAIESGFKERSVSSANAVGMWQFTEETAKEWGLIVNDKVDERNDWRKSTVVAIKYIKWMANRYFEGDYESAILAYNAGIGRVNRAMRDNNTNDPWELIELGVLPEESNNFLPKYISYLHYYYYLKNQKKIES